ncbi:hypothetical protein BHE74_00014936 [Ensete ventricosum]|nr:hypothetical protein GW17_00031631 [Ensete ventricosum]RWW76934.1 hypothetical protein BHE74_00014936 [Ensete ventricosum]
MDAANVRHGSRTPRWLGASEKEEPVAERIGRHGWLAAARAEMLLRLGSSERWRYWLATAGASAIAVAATGDRLAAAEVVGEEEQ